MLTEKHFKMDFLITKFGLGSFQEKCGIFHALITAETEFEENYCLYFYWDLEGVCQMDKFFKAYDDGAKIAVSDITGGEWQYSYEYSNESKSMDSPTEEPMWTKNDSKALEKLIEESAKILKVEEDEEGSYRILNWDFYEDKNNYIEYDGPYQWHNNDFADKTICTDAFDDEWVKDIAAIMQVI